MYVLAVIAILQGILTLLDGIRAARHMRMYRPAPATRHDRVVVFCPCKGTDPEFEKNVQSILDQDYPNYSVQFIVDSETDPAYATLRKFRGGHPRRRQDCRPRAEGSQPGFRGSAPATMPTSMSSATPMHDFRRTGCPA